MTLHNIAVPAKDGSSNPITGGVRQHDVSGTGAGPNIPEQVVVDSTGAEVLGTTADAKNGASDATPISGMSAWKQISFSIQAAAASLVSLVSGAVAVGQTTMAFSIPVAVASDQTPVKVIPGVSSTTNGATPSRVNSAASNNATSLKASAGQLYTIDVYNISAATAFLKLYNKASAPAPATDNALILMTIPIPAGGSYSKTWPMGFPFSTGIAYAIVKNQSDTDNTSIAAGDVTGNCIWI